MATDKRSLRVLELFCGIGGVAAALGDAVHVVAGVDIHSRALQTYRHNFPHPTYVRTIESISSAQLKDWNADLWWLSPPCQPYTSRGRQLDLSDTRAAALVALIDQVRKLRPTYVALENVPGFHGSQSHQRLRSMLDECGYQVIEHHLCPSELGVPNRRRRFYLLASRNGFAALPSDSIRPPGFTIRDILEDGSMDEYDVPAEMVAVGEETVHVVDALDHSAVTRCFTSAYGRSIAYAGSLLRTGTGYRRFSPAEILRLLCFPVDYVLPPEIPPAKLWPLVGNSLSIRPVRRLLACVPQLATLVADSRSHSRSE